MKNVCVIGGTSVNTVVHLDQLPAPLPQTIQNALSYRSVGNTGAGKAFNMKALGMNITLHTVLGRDLEAQIVKDELQARDIDFLFEEIDGSTEQHINLMAPIGQRISIFTHSLPDEVEINWSPLRQVLEASDLVVVNILSYTRPIMEVARQLGKPIWTDLHDYDGKNPYYEGFINAAEVLFLSSDNLSEYRQFMEKAIQDGKKFVVCTHGKDGATLLTAEGEWIEQMPFQIEKVVDTNGAGDAFFSAFLYGYLQGKSYQECMALAAANGALCVTSKSLAAEQLSPEVLSAYMRSQL